MLYQVSYKNDVTDDTRVEYVVSNSKGNAEVRAQFKLALAVKGGFIRGPLFAWECVHIKKMDDKPYREEDSQLFYV
jgi:hypothetical protein